jgi:hypothetical protein
VGDAVAREGKFCRRSATSRRTGSTTSTGPPRARLRSNRRGADQRAHDPSRPGRLRRSSSAVAPAGIEDRTSRPTPYAVPSTKDRRLPIGELARSPVITARGAVLGSTGSSRWCASRPVIRHLARAGSGHATTGLAGSRKQALTSLRKGAAARRKRPIRAFLLRTQDWERPVRSRALDGGRRGYLGFRGFLFFRRSPCAGHFDRPRVRPFRGPGGPPEAQTGTGSSLRPAAHGTGAAGNTVVPSLRSWCASSAYAFSSLPSWRFRRANLPVRLGEPERSGRRP